MKPHSGSHFAGVLGWPLEHTLSPAIHNAAFRAVGLDWVYLAWPVPPEMLRDAIAGVRALGARGANVTIPHKVDVMEWLDGISPDAEAIGAVNSIERIGDRLIGHNTDCEGFRRFLLDDAGYDAAGRDVLILGAGGAARAVARAVAGLGAERVVVAARRLAAAAAVASVAAGAAAPWEEAGEIADAADVVVNATPLGAGSEDALPSARFRPGQLVVDIVYHPPSTPMIERARSAGADAWGGLGMLVHQAAASFRQWTGQDAPLEAMSAAAVRATARDHQH